MGLLGRWSSNIRRGRWWHEPQLDGALEGNVGDDGAVSTDGSSTGNPDTVVFDIPVRPKTSV